MWYMGDYDWPHKKNEREPNTDCIIFENVCVNGYVSLAISDSTKI